MTAIIPPKTSIGHVHLTIANLERSLSFYRDMLGFQISAKYGDSAIFLSAGGYHHHIGLNTWSGGNAQPPPKGSSGLYHFAILLPNRKDLAVITKNLIDKNYPITGMADHGVSEAIYLLDPDNIGVELYVDRPRNKWRMEEDGKVVVVTKPLDMDNLMRELD